MSFTIIEIIVGLYWDDISLYFQTEEKLKHLVKIFATYLVNKVAKFSANISIFIF